MASPNSLKCRWCEFRVPRWRKLPNGKSEHGSRKLYTHAVNAHEEEFDALNLSVVKRWCSDPLTLPTDDCPFCGKADCLWNCAWGEKVREVMPEGHPERR